MTRRRIAGSLAVAWLWGASAAATGCATYTDKTERMRVAVQRGDLAGGLEETNKNLGVRSDTALPGSWDKETPLVVLERGTILHGLRRYEDSATNWQAADKELELLDIGGDVTGSVAKYVWSDSATKYRAPPVEKLALNAFNMLNYLAVGDLAGARVESRRFTTMRDYLRNFDPEHAYGGFGSYLAGFTMERLGERDAALRYYDEALEERTLMGLLPVLRRIWTPGSFTSPRIENLLGARTLEDGSSGDQDDAQASGGELLVVVNVGRVPYRIPERIPIGMAIGIAGAFVTGDTRVLERTALKFINYPELRPAENLYDSAVVSVGGTELYTELVTDISGHVIREYTELKPKLLGAAISRLIVRALAAEGARAAGKQQSGALGLIAALAVEGSMVAADRPDTRSWTTLPAQVFMARETLPAGQHEVEVILSGNSGTETRVHEVTMTAGGFVVLDVTTLR